MARKQKQYLESEPAANAYLSLVSEYYNKKLERNKRDSMSQSNKYYHLKKLREYRLFKENYSPNRIAPLVFVKTRFQKNDSAKIEAAEQITAEAEADFETKMLLFFCVDNQSPFEAAKLIKHKAREIFGKISLKTVLTTLYILCTENLPIIEQKELDSSFCVYCGQVKSPLKKIPKNSLSQKTGTITSGLDGVFDTFRKKEYWNAVIHLGILD